MAGMRGMVSLLAHKVGDAGEIPLLNDHSGGSLGCLNSGVISLGDELLLVMCVGDFSLRLPLEGRLDTACKASNCSGILGVAGFKIYSSSSFISFCPQNTSST